MGYCGLKTVYSSDHAADLIVSCQRAFTKALNDGLQKDSNEYNTPGWVNVALIIESGIMDKFELYDYKVDWKFLITKLQEEITNSDSDKIRLWSNEDNRREHHDAYKRMLQSVRNFLDKKKIKYEPEISLEVNKDI